MPCLERLLVLIRWQTLPNSLFTNVCRYNKNCKDCQHAFIFNKHNYHLISLIVNIQLRHFYSHWKTFNTGIALILFPLFSLHIFVTDVIFFLSLCNQFGVICNVKLIRLYLAGWYVCQNMHSRWSVMHLGSTNTHHSKDI